jgi:hypothetical protein
MLNEAHTKSEKSNDQNGNHPIERGRFRPNRGLISLLISAISEAKGDLTEEAKAT